MPGNYKRTSTRKSWSHEDMAQAIEAVKENRMGWLLASKHFNVPQVTLRRHYRSIPENLGRFKPTFNAEIEKELVYHILEFERRLFGFNTTEIRKLAYEFAEKMGLDHRFNRDNQIAGWDWLKGFRARNPNISLRAPEPTSAARARAFNKPQVRKFFSLLEKTVTDNGIQAQRIYNMDESGLNTVQKPPKVFASKGKKQVGAVTSAERGEHFTVVACANAIGNFVPPALIIPRKNHKAEHFDGAPPGTLELCYPSGYMVGTLFLKWMRHFVSFVNATTTNKVLLILDGHSSHKNLEALEFAKANGVIMLCLPPHCTHRMQSTDVSFFGPLQAYYDRQMATWMKNHPGRTVGLYQVAHIFGRAYENAASVRNITSGFEQSGIYPFNPHIFPEDMFLPSEVTENELNDDDEPVPSSSFGSQLDQVQSNSSESSDTGEQIAVAATPPRSQTEFQESGSKQPTKANEQIDATTTPDNDYQKQIADATVPAPDNIQLLTGKSLLYTIYQLPKAASTGKTRVNRKVGGSQVLTASPYMNEIKAHMQQKIQNLKSLKIKKQTKRVILGDENVEPESTPKKRRSTRARKQKKQEYYEEDEDEKLEDPYANKDEEECDPACIYCNELFSQSRPKEHWVKCQLCSNWCHTLCAGIPAKKNSLPANYAQEINSQSKMTYICHFRL